MSERRLLTIESPDRFTQPYQWLQSDGVTPVNITGYSVFARFTVGAVQHNLAEGTGITTVDATGMITLTLTGTQVAAFEEHFGSYELWVVPPGGNSTDDRVTLLEGALFVSL